MSMPIITSFLNRLQKVLQTHRSKQLSLSPIFILSPPRSGSTLLFETMFNFNELYHLPYESDFIWWELFPYDRTQNPSDYVYGNEYSKHSMQHYTKLYIEGIVNTATTSGKQLNIDEYMIDNNYIRVVDKTIANCFHLEYLNKAFPDSQYIFLFRDPRDNISSMIEGWPYIDRFGKAQLSSQLSRCADATISHWTYPAPPGWQNEVTKPIEEICAWSWLQHVNRMVDFMQSLGKDKYVVVKYEDMINSSKEVYEEIANKLSLTMTNSLYKTIESPQFSSTTVSAPKNDKWKDKYYDQISSILPYTRLTALKIGYLL